jgi:hypothetical protein
MFELQFRDAVEAEFREQQWLLQEIAESVEAAVETLSRMTALDLRAEDAPAKLAAVTWYPADLMGVLAPLPLGPPRSVFIMPRQRDRMRSAKVRRVFISHTGQVARNAPAELRFSQETLDLTRRGFFLNASSLEDLFEEKVEKFNVSDENVSSFIRDRLILTFGGVADFLTQYGKSEFLIANEGNFIDAIDRLLQSRIPNVPKEFGALSRSICLDIVRHLRSGGRVEAASGKLEVNGSNLTLVATGTPVSPPKPVGRARLIE